MTTKPESIFAINLYSYIFSHNAADAVRHLADQGYPGFELMMFPNHLWYGKESASQRAELARTGRETGVKFVSSNMPNIDLNITGAAKEMRDYSLNLLENFIEVSGELGVPKMVIGPGKANPLFPAPRNFLRGCFFEAMDRLLPVARKNDVTLLVENMPFAFLPDADSIMEILDEYGADDVGVIYDVANGHFIKEEPAEGLRRVKDRLQLVHFSDTGQRVYKHDPVGMGDVPFASVPSVLKEIGYDDYPVLEVVSADPDRETRDSAAKLAAQGYA